MLLEGKGVKQNKEEAVKYFKKGVELGLIDSYFYYGSVLFYGEIYLRYAADKGSVYAMEIFMLMREKLQNIIKWLQIMVI